MSYEVFKAELSNALDKSDRLPHNYLFQTTTKNNGVVINTLTLKDPDSPIAPNLHMDYYYECYTKGEPIEKIVQSIEEVYAKKPDLSNINPKLTWDLVKDHIVFSLINYETNQEYLAHAPHIPLLDLAVIFKINADFLNISGFININDELLNYLGVTKRDLIVAAWAVTAEELPIYFVRLSDILDNKGLPEEAMHVPVWMSTNSDKTFGASTILYRDFEDALKTLGIVDCYIIPSSVHEVLIVPLFDAHDISELETMVKEVNASDMLPDTDYLSNTVYLYSDIKKALDEIFISA